MGGLENVPILSPVKEVVLTGRGVSNPIKNLPIVIDAAMKTKGIKKRKRNCKSKMWQTSDSEDDAFPVKKRIVKKKKFLFPKRDSCDDSSSGESLPPSRIPHSRRAKTQRLQPTVSANSVSNLTVSGVEFQASGQNTVPQTLIQSLKPAYRCCEGRSEDHSKVKFSANADSQKTQKITENEKNSYSCFQPLKEMNTCMQSRSSDLNTESIYQVCDTDSKVKKEFLRPRSDSSEEDTSKLSEPAKIVDRIMKKGPMVEEELRNQHSHEMCWNVCVNTDDELIRMRGRKSLNRRKCRVGNKGSKNLGSTENVKMDEFVDNLSQIKDIYDKSKNSYFRERVSESRFNHPVGDGSDKLAQILIFLLEEKARTSSSNNDRELFRKTIHSLVCKGCEDRDKHNQDQVICKRCGEEVIAKCNIGDQTKNDGVCDSEEKHVLFERSSIPSGVVIGIKCEYCDELFDQQEDLNIHSRIPHIRDCLRKGCGMKFVSLSGLIKHTFNKHKKSDIKSTEKSESCLVSGKGVENETASDVGLKQTKIIGDVNSKDSRKIDREKIFGDTDDDELVRLENYSQLEPLFEDEIDTEARTCVIKKRFK